MHKIPRLAGSGFYESLRATPVADPPAIDSIQDRILAGPERSGLDGSEFSLPVGMARLRGRPSSTIRSGFAGGVPSVSAGIARLRELDGLRLVAGIDVSGIENRGNDNFVALVMGTAESIAAAAKTVSVNDRIIHMSDIKNKQDQDAIFSKLNFIGKTITASCIRIDRQETIDLTLDSKPMLRNPFARDRIYSQFNSLLRQELMRPTQKFLLERRHTIDEVVCQCDQDCRPLAKIIGFKLQHKGVVHMLADIVAWFNNRGKEPAGVKQIDSAGTLRAKLRQSYNPKQPKKRPSKH